MKKSRKILAFFLVVCLLALAGCQKKQEEEVTKYSMYYLALSETKLETVPFEPSTEDTETMIQEIYQKLSEPPDSEEYLRLLPDGVLMKNYSFEGQTVTLNFDEEYKKMNNARRSVMILFSRSISTVISCINSLYSSAGTLSCPASESARTLMDVMGVFSS